MAAHGQVPVVRVSSLADINQALTARTQMDQAGQVRFELDERTPLQQAFFINLVTNSGRHGFILNNPELMTCKTRAKGELEESSNAMLASSMRLIDQELNRVEATIASLKVFVLYTDDQIDQRLARPPPIPPPLVERNRGVQECIYPHPLFPQNQSFEYDTGNQRVPYQPPYVTQQEMDDAAARDRRAQRTVWDIKLKIMEMKHSILTKMKIEMLQKMRDEFRKILDEASDLGIGYADYQFPPLV